MKVKAQRIRSERIANWVRWPLSDGRAHALLAVYVQAMLMPYLGAVYTAVSINIYTMRRESLYIYMIQSVKLDELGKLLVSLGPFLFCGFISLCKLIIFTAF